MTQTQQEATSLATYLRARGYTVTIHHADAAGITITASRDPLTEDLGTAPLANTTTTTPLYPGAPLRPLPAPALQPPTTRTTEP